MEKPFIPDRYSLSIIKSLSRAFESAISYYEFDLKDFLLKFIKTDIFKNYELDFTVYCQAPTYPIGKAIDELNKKNIIIHKMTSNELEDKDYYSEAARWIGYLLMYWKFLENIDEHIFEQYDVDAIIYGYEMLHTQSINYAIRFIKEEYKIMQEDVK